ncbi:Anthranilate synthase component II [Solibacillus isronensis B3W22]|uniref:Anthranilate synthase component II n=1 Tax=Solibacillus isronensis B3W22 TaxID=1224748 RepID=K1LGD4_9BACL|nr:aminodeoxychorismate/anthranilate synthase component II [Solibacillus isronensis]AMO86042.1 glutamine amidotransferase [Solibacillus silvestris]EKB43574.1 Anthranilate synthase component II [Solibacillus isronensis B3W22]
MILLIDNYDSFTYNLYHQIAQFGEDIKIIRNDAITVEEIRALQPKAIVISPGPGEPRDAGIVIEMIRDLYKEIPILGICLGHQSIGEAFGATVSRAKNIMHGKTSLLQFEKTGLFAQFEREVEVMRYHSLIIEKQTLHEDFRIVATSADDGEIMAIQHKQYPVYGLQFHPESIGTELGKDMISMFLKKVEVLA